jgi:cell fate regulator YaaT (PSP1 superfamily)
MAPHVGGRDAIALSNHRGGACMTLIVGIRFKRAGRVYYFDPANHELSVGDYAVLETSRGTEVGRVTIAPRQVEASDVTEPLKPVVRRASAADLLLQQHFKGEEASALERCRQEVSRHSLSMKLVGGEYNYDGSRLTFFFTSETRVDFRDLVKELASIFKTRIELRQVGARDEAKHHGGLGRCGRPLCCTAFLGEFASVSIRMAKDQDLPLNPMKISGCCGRLLCCLGYENSLYCELKQQMPRVGEAVGTHVGNGTVCDLNVIKGTVVVDITASQTRVEMPVEQLRAVAPATPPADGPAKGTAVGRPGQAPSAKATLPAAATVPAATGGRPEGPKGRRR